MKYWDLFVAFFRSTMLGYGGGPSTIPLVHKEVVSTYKWFTDEEFGETLAVGNTLPGPIATKMAGYIGYRIGGVAGMLIALFATVLPTVLIMIAVLSFLDMFKQTPRVQNMIAAVTPVVGVMLVLLTLDFLKKTRKDLGPWKAVLFIVCSATMLHGFGIHPAIVIGVFLTGGFLLGGR